MLVNAARGGLSQRLVAVLAGESLTRCGQMVCRAEAGEAAL